MSGSCGSVTGGNTKNVEQVGDAKGTSGPHANHALPGEQMSKSELDALGAELGMQSSDEYIDEMSQRYKEMGAVDPNADPEALEKALLNDYETELLETALPGLDKMKDGERDQFIGDLAEAVRDDDSEKFEGLVNEHRQQFDAGPLDISTDDMMAVLDSASNNHNHGADDSIHALTNGSQLGADGNKNPFFARAHLVNLGDQGNGELIGGRGNDQTGAQGGIQQGLLFTEEGEFALDSAQGLSVTPGDVRRDRSSSAGLM